MKINPNPKKEAPAYVAAGANTNLCVVSEPHPEYGVKTLAPEGDMGDTLYVVSRPLALLDNGCTIAKKLFAAYGIVKSAGVITDKLTGRCREFGSVEMSSEDEARNTLGALNRTQLESRYVGRSALKN